MMVFLTGFLAGVLFATGVLVAVGLAWNRRETVRVLAEMAMADTTVKARASGRLAQASEMVQ